MEHCLPDRFADIPCGIVYGAGVAVKYMLKNPHNNYLSAIK